MSPLNSRIVFVVSLLCCASPNVAVAYVSLTATVQNTAQQNNIDTMSCNPCNRNVSASLDTTPGGPPGDASASGFTLSGSLHAYGASFVLGQDGANGYSSAVGRAEIDETLTYHIPFANNTTITVFPILAGVHGLTTANGDAKSSITASGSYQVNMTGDAFWSGDSWVFSEVNTASHFMMTSCYQGFGNVNLAQCGGSNFFSSTFRVRGSDPTVQFQFILNASASYGGISDFSDTAAVDILLPPGVTFTASDPDFLTSPLDIADLAAGVPQPSGIPEPGSLYLMLPAAFGFSVIALCKFKSDAIDGAMALCGILRNRRE